ncbi:hypothetical protein [Reyranella sp.]|uniref:hypothetical protein n=1 Tax=Reyranella sp. TaxID=1929291 RepID=UPI003D0DB871
MRTINAIALAYDSAQDRVLAVINPGGLNSWSYWLTRRLILQLLGRLPAALAATSKVAKQAPAEYRGDLAAFEREVAVAKTAPAMSKTDDSVLRMNATTAELAVTVALKDMGETLRIALIGERGGQAAGVMSRPDLQRIIHMLELEVAKAEWVVKPAPSAESGPAPKRLVN